MSDNRWKRAIAVAWWKVVNPPTRPLAGVAPWWVLLEHTGARTGLTRRTPLAAGPREPDGMWLIATHGRHASWVCNVEHTPRVRLRHKRRWYDGTASVHPLDATTLRRFNAYARTGASRIGIDPLLVRIDYVR